MTQIAFTNGSLLQGQTHQANASGTALLRGYGLGINIALDMSDVTRHPQEEMTKLLNALSGGRPSAPNLGDDYANESALTVETSGRQLRFTAVGEMVDYVRVLDADDEEIAYWVSDEWSEDPPEVLGAMLGALNGGNV